MPDVLYVGLQDDDKIVSFGIDAGSGKLVPSGETPAAGAPSVFALSPDRRVLYVGYRAQGGDRRPSRVGPRARGDGELGATAQFSRNATHPQGAKDSRTCSTTRGRPPGRSARAG